MNVVVILLTVLAIIGLIAGIVLVASGKIVFARCNLGSNSYSYLYCTQNREIQKKWGHK